MNKKLPRSHFLVKSDHFKNTYGGKRIENSSFIIYSNDNCEEFSRIAVVVSKKFGKSVKRNKIRRQVKEYFRNNRNEKCNKDYIIIPKRKREIQINLLSEII